MVEPMRVLYLALLAFVCTGAVAEQNGSPRLIRLGCNFDGGLAWLAPVPVLSWIPSSGVAQQQMSNFGSDAMLVHL